MNQRALDSNDGRSIAPERMQNMAIEVQAYALVDTHQHFRRRAGRFVFRCDAGGLTVLGSVPSYYLKQVLQNVLQDLPGIRAIDNRVTVVSSQGMSSISTEGNWPANQNRLDQPDQQVDLTHSF